MLPREKPRHRFHVCQLAHDLGFAYIGRQEEQLCLDFFCLHDRAISRALGTLQRGPELGLDEHYAIGPLQTKIWPAAVWACPLYVDAGRQRLFFSSQQRSYHV